jgi:rhodanese-related sulfurtransferase
MVIRHHQFIKAVLLSYVMLFCSGTVSAVDKPHAPEQIAGATTLSAEQVVGLILSNPDTIIIDSRKKTEYSKGHIEGAINLLNTELTLDDLQTVAPDKSQALLFYCNGTRCLRSTDSINKALDWGYTNIFWFRGGWQEWSEKKLPVISE